MTGTRLILLVAAVAGMSAQTKYQSEIAQWRHDREAALRASGGWLSVAGLFWLHEGANPFGRDAANEIALPDGPARAGVFNLNGGKVTVTMDGATRELAHDSDDAAKVGRLSMYVILRGERYGIRLKDPESEYVKRFHGIDYFPADEHYRVTAKFISEARKIPVLNILGQTEDSENPGYAVFQLQGHEMRLYPILEEPDAKELFYIFRDLTTGKETYPAGRFLYSDMPKDGHVVLDFNKAYNPPCAFTAYATCPVPPKENYMQVKIEAGEKKPAGSH